MSHIPERRAADVSVDGTAAEERGVIQAIERLEPKLHWSEL